MQPQLPTTLEMCPRVHFTRRKPSTNFGFFSQVITVEPGCYFVEATLGPALQDPDLSRFFVLEEIEKLRGSGGVRIEDDVVRLYTPESTFMPFCTCVRLFSSFPTLM